MRQELTRTRAASFLALPVAAGAFLPWLAWAALGGLDAPGLAAATFALVVAYLMVVTRIGDREQEMRRRLGRRYVPPSAEIALALCGGLALTFVTPGLSAGMLTQAVGLPRATGEVALYDAGEMMRRGAEVRASDAMPPGSRLLLLPGGEARIAVPRFGRMAEFAATWRAHGEGVCLSSAWCLALDPSNGRLTVPGPRPIELGRVIAYDAAARPGPAAAGTPAEIGQLFDWARSTALP